MWQRKTRKENIYHMLLGVNYGFHKGSKKFETACGKKLVIIENDLASFPPMDVRCEVCVGIWRLVCTSVDDAKITLKTTSNLIVLNRSLEITKSVTLKKAINARINKLLREGSHASV